jgi:hypothetical protein
LVFAFCGVPFLLFTAFLPAQSCGRLPLPHLVVMPGLVCVAALVFTSYTLYLASQHHGTFCAAGGGGRVSTSRGY